jgi:hypothetical protein
MRYAVFAVCLALAGCPAVQVDEVNVNDPEVNADVDAPVNVNANGTVDKPTTEDPQRQVVTAKPDAGTSTDFDGDGVPDEIDRCPTDGDSDKDGLCDNEDPCPQDVFGDRDRDGLCDSADPCPDGPTDRDADGVCDGEDKCPNDAADDSDGDGLCDSDDRCPLDALDDSDGDGSCDTADRCADHDDTADADQDGVPDGCDTCPAGTDADEDDNGYADGCEQELWSQVIRMPAPTAWVGTYVSQRPGLALLVPLRDQDCLIDGVGFGFLGVEVPNLLPEQTATIILPRPTEGLPAKLIECLEAGVETQAYGALSTPSGGYAVTFTAGVDVPTASFEGHHIAYFKVEARTFWTSAGSPSGTTIQQFDVTMTAHGY